MTPHNSLFLGPFCWGKKKNPCLGPVVPTVQSPLMSNWSRPLEGPSILSGSPLEASVRQENTAGAAVAVYSGGLGLALGFLNEVSSVCVYGGWGGDMRLN